MSPPRVTKPVLVAGFFVWASSSVAQVTTVEPVAEQAAVLPYVQADTSTDFTGSQPLPSPSTDSRSLALRVQQLEEEIRRLNGLVEEQASDGKAWHHHQPDDNRPKRTVPHNYMSADR